jgi:uncharacterized spore protein YtfJ
MSDNNSNADRFAQTFSQFFGDPSPSTVFSPPERIGDDLVIVAAAWERAGGFGYGQGQAPGEGSGFGGGGGGASQGRPVAVIRVTPRGVEVRPVIDLTKITVTALFAAIGVWRALRR